MSTKRLLQQCFCIFTIIGLVACANQPIALPTDTSIPTSIPTTLTSTSTITTSPTSLPITVNPSPTPNQPFFSMITPDSTQTEHWREYQNALAEVFVPKLPPETVVCEWEILGVTETDIYVWAICKGITRAGTLASPAVIHIGPDRDIQNVERPRGGSHYASDIRRMFPPNVQDRIFNDLIAYQQFYDHLEARRTSPEEPPLVILSATPMP